MSSKLDSKNSEDIIELNELFPNNDKNNQEINVETPLLNDSNNVTINNEMIPNQTSDPSATQEEVENDNLLIQETNLDEINAETDTDNQLDNQVDNQTDLNKFEKVKIAPGFICASIFLLASLLFLTVFVPASIKSLNYDEVSSF
jgi:hypothetical protein